MKRKRHVIVIGAGAAGLMAAAAAADAGAQVTVLEKNEKAGKKIYITGKGRCNLTNACETQDFFDHVVRNPKYLYSAVYGFDQFAVMQFMEENGCPVKTERGSRVFPVSDHASDVTKALLHHLRNKCVNIRYYCEADKILTEQPAGRVTGVLLKSGETIPADAVILCTGGLSYPSTGSTGDGLRMAEKLGLAVVQTAPSLVPLITKEDWCRQLQGLSLKNVRLTLFPAGEEDCNRTEARKQAEGGNRTEAWRQVESGNRTEAWRQAENGVPTGKDVRTVQFRGEIKKLTETDGENRNSEKNRNKAKNRKGRKRSRPLYSGLGEMLFTHFGISGPLALTASCYTDFKSGAQEYPVRLDLKPGLTHEQLEARLRREFEAAPGRQTANIMRSLFPARLAAVMASLSGLGAGRTASSVREKDIRDFAALIKSVPIHITGTRGFSEAIITKGGIDVRQFIPSTMECRTIPGLYAAGEILDVDAHTGGFNLQIAWSTGHLAGESAAQER